MHKILACHILNVESETIPGIQHESFRSRLPVLADFVVFQNSECLIDTSSTKDILRVKIVSEIFCIQSIQMGKDCIQLSLKYSPSVRIKNPRLLIAKLRGLILLLVRKFVKQLFGPTVEVVVEIAELGNSLDDLPLHERRNLLGCKDWHLFHYKKPNT